MFDTLTDRLDGTFKKLRSRGKLHPKQVDNALTDMRTALLEADVAVEVTDDFLDRVRERALSEEVMKSLTPGQQVIKVVNEELTVTLGGEHHPFELGGRGRPRIDTHRCDTQGSMPGERSDVECDAFGLQRARVPVEVGPPRTNRRSGTRKVVGVEIET